jgi:hypothetical protein
MRIVMTMIGLGAILAAVPATAADTSANSTNAKSTAAGTAKGPTYCIKNEPLSGTRMSTTACKSKAEWAREGIDVDELVKQGR